MKLLGIPFHWWALVCGLLFLFSAVLRFVGKDYVWASLNGGLALVQFAVAWIWYRAAVTSND